MSPKALIYDAGRWLGMIAGGASLALWVSIIWFPIQGLMLEGVAIVVGALMGLFGLVAAIASYHGHATVVFVCFVASFFGVGTFALNVENWFRIFGLLDLVLLLASAMIWYSTRNAEDRH